MPHDQDQIAPETVGVVIGNHNAGLRADWRRYHGPQFLHADALALPFADHKRGFVRFISQVAEVREVTSPLPWTSIWATLPDRGTPGRG